MNTTSSKAEYLKRYLENDNETKRKKKKLKSKTCRLKIIETNIDLKNIKFGERDDAEEDEDEAPAIAEMNDDKSLKERLMAQYESDQWKKIGESADRVFNASSPQRSPNSLSSKKSRSPYPSKNKHDSDNSSSSKQKHPSKHLSKYPHRSDSDTSPPRKHINQISNSLSRKRYDSSSDASPPRNISNQITNSSSRKRHDSDSDFSPPRNPPEQTSNPSKQRDYDSDISPPRNPSKYAANSSFRKNHNSDSDISPSRNPSKRASNSSSRTCDNSDNDISPSGNQLKSTLKKDRDKYRSQKSTGRSSKKHDLDSDHSPIRKKNNLLRNSDSDLSPPRQATLTSYKSSNKSDQKLEKTLSGLKAGLQNAVTLKKEVRERKEREEAQIKQMNSELSGRNAKTTVRDRHTGKRRDFEEENRVQEEKEKKKSEKDKIYSAWGKGIEQNEKQKNNMLEDLYEMTKPLARHCDDEDLEQQLKSVIHDEDPMSEYMRKKKQKSITSSMPEYKGPPPPPNRFGIKPGYRWDGVDRSNGFEKKYFEKCSSVKASAEESYLWSVQDM